MVLNEPAMPHQMCTISKLTKEETKTRENKRAKNGRNEKGRKGGLTEGPCDHGGRNGGLGISLSLTHHKILNK